MSIPPGITYLFHTLLLCLPLSILAYSVLGFSASYFGLTTGTWVNVFLSLLARPLFLVASHLWTRCYERWDAANRGAVLAPRVKGTSVSLMKAIVENFKSGYIGDIFLEWCEEYGNTYGLNLFSENRIFTYEPEYIKAILATQFEIFDKGPVLFTQFHSFLGTGVFNSDGDMWKFHRTITRPFFSKDRISHFEVFETHASDALNQATQRLADDYPIDFQDLVSRFTLDSATEFLFGNDVGSLSAGLPYPEHSPLANSPAFINHSSNIFVNAFITGMNLTALRTRYGQNWPLMEFWSDTVKPHRDIVNQFIDPMLSEALAKRAAMSKMSEVDAKKAGSNDTLLAYLVEQTQDNQILKDELTNLLVAARDTTASTLTFAMYMLTQHPDIVQRLRTEILQTVGHGRPSYENMKDMKYLRAFINETLRLYPPVPTDSRTSNKATVWPSKTPGSRPIYIPANTKATYGVFIMHRRKDLWGPDADDFDPDRFLDERLHKYLTPNPFIFLPFNAGPRICLGQQFAYHEASFFLIRLLQRFAAFHLAEDARPKDSRPPASWASCKGTKGRDKIYPQSHLTMFVKGGLWIRMDKAQGTEFDEV